MDKTEKELEWEMFVKAAKKQHMNKIISMMIKIHKDINPNLTNDELRNKVINGFQKAIVYRFSLDEHIIEFINLTFLWGNDFDRSDKTPWAQEILYWENASNEARIRALIAKSEHILDVNR